MSKNTLGQRLKAARLAMKPRRLSQTEMGIAVGEALDKSFTASAVGQWENDRAEPERRAIIEWAKLTGADPAYLFMGVAASWLGTSGRIARGGRVVSKVLVMPKEPNLRPLEQEFHTHFPCSESAYLFEVFDARNAPLYTRGDHVVIDPNEQPVPGDMVLAMVDSAPIFGVFSRSARFSGGAIEAVDPKWGAEEIDADRGDRILGVMTEHARPRRN
jgi:transcriptional regulator with XRE-family HTH domain